MKLWPFQEECVSELLAFVEQQDIESGLVTLPTGAGKTVIFSAFVQKLLAINPATRILVLAHTQEIVQQNADKLALANPDFSVGIVCAGLKRQDIGQITSASRDSFVSVVGENPDWDVVIVDEAHLLPPKSDSRYQRILAVIRLHHGSPKVLGFTATPFRMDTGLLYRANHGKTSAGTRFGQSASKRTAFLPKQSQKLSPIKRQAYVTGGDMNEPMFERLIYRRNMVDLIRAGYLAQVRAVKVDEQAVIDSTQIKHSLYEFNQNELERFTQSQAMVDNIVRDWWFKVGPKMKTVFYAASISQLDLFLTAFDELGVAVPFITAQTPKLERQSILTAFDGAETGLILNVQTLTTGWDCPSIECIVMARPTLSLALFLQVIGRGLRIGDRKFETLVLDYGQNFDRFGTIERVRAVSEMSNFDDFFSGRSLVTSCPVCDTLVSFYDLECPHCTEVLNDDTSLSVCPSCNSGNDRYAEECDLCGEVFERE